MKWEKDSEFSSRSLDQAKMTRPQVMTSLILIGYFLSCVTKGDDVVCLEYSLFNFKPQRSAF